MVKRLCTKLDCYIEVHTSAALQIALIHFSNYKQDTQEADKGQEKRQRKVQGSPPFRNLCELQLGERMWREATDEFTCKKNIDQILSKHVLYMKLSFTARKKGSHATGTCFPSSFARSNFSPLKSGWFDSFPHKCIDRVLFLPHNGQVCAFGRGLQWGERQDSPI